jgi:hypothetical protein
MNNIYDVLEICLQELENGADLETVLARYPDLVSELRPILKASVMAKTMAVPAPSPDAVRRGRAKLLQHASEMREAKGSPRKRMIPFFQRLAISFAMTALLLSSGTGLVSASSSALPGENLYPVKLTWENIRLFFTFNEEFRETLEYTFEDERLHEVNELLVEGRHETIQFSGVYMEVNGITYVSGIHVVVLDTSNLPAEPLLNGMAVVVIGHTNAEGFVDVESIGLLPTGSVVPPGQPVEVEKELNDNGDDTPVENSNDNVNDDGEDENSNVNDSIDVNSNDDSNEDEINTNDSTSDDNVNDNSEDGADSNDNKDESDEGADSNDNKDDNSDNSNEDGGGDNGDSD